MLPKSLTTAENLPRQDISLVLDNYAAIRKPRIEKFIKWGRNTGTVGMSESKIVKGVMEVVLKLATGSSGRHLKWVYEPETLVKESPQV